MKRYKNIKLAALSGDFKRLFNTEMNLGREQKGDDFVHPYEGLDNNPIAKRNKILKKLLEMKTGAGVSIYDVPPLLGLDGTNAKMVAQVSGRTLIACLATHIAFIENRADKDEYMKLAKKISAGKYFSYAMEDYFDVALASIASLDGIPAEIRKLAKITARYGDNPIKRILLLGRTTEELLKNPKAKELTKEGGTFASTGKTYFKALISGAGEGISIPLLSTASGGQSLLGPRLKTLLAAENPNAGNFSDLKEKTERLEKVLKERKPNIKERVEAFTKTLSEMNLTPDEEQAIQTILVAKGYNFEKPKSSKLAKDLLLNAEQEDAMEKEGLVKISAGAGAGKTRVLSAKVARALEDDVSIYNIIATSFTRDSANDLREKVEAIIGKGSKVDLSTTFIGRTTHSIATELVNKYNMGAARKEILDTGSFEGTQFISSSYKSLKAGNFKEYIINFIEDKPLLKESLQEVKNKETRKLAGLINIMIQSARFGVKRGIPSLAKHLNDLIEASDNIKNNEEISGEARNSLVSIASNITSIKDQETVNSFHKAFRKVYQDELADDTLYLLFAETHGIDSDDEEEVAAQIEKSKVDKAKSALGIFVDKKINIYNKSVKSSKKSSGNWWELGLDLEKDKSDTGVPKKVKSLLGKKRLSLFITKAKSNVLSPEECYNNVVKNANLAGKKLSEALRGKGDEKPISQLILSCAYKAYQLNLEERNMRDHDDTIIETIRLLKNKNIRTELQTQYKHIIVDEAQDLNPAQHMMFGLLAGTYEPNNRTKDAKPTRSENPTKSDGEYTLIGDVKQSIYGFRGAEPDQFDHRSESQQQVDLTLNYRSGSSIVNTMNNFVQNFVGGEEETGSLCTPNYDKSKGSIKKMETGTAEEAVKSFADNIEKALKDPYGNDRFSDFGVAARTNAELIPYAFALLEKGIPFRCGVNPFKMRATSDIINIMKVLSEKEYERDWATLYCAQVFGYDFMTKYNIDLKKALPVVAEVYKDLTDNAELRQMKLGFANGFGPFLKDRKNITENDLKAFLANSSLYVEQCLVPLLKLRGKSGSEVFNLVLGYNRENDCPKRANGSFLFEKYSDNKMIQQELEKLKASQGDAEGDEDSESDINFSPLSYLQRLFTEGVTTAGTYGREDDLSEGENPTNYSTDNSIQVVLEKLQQMKKDADNSSLENVSKDADVVILDTVHGWKGLETKHIYVPMIGGKFPSERIEPDYTTDDINENELRSRKLKEEARLAYVAVTRGKESANIVTYKQRQKGDEMVDVKESDFLKHICVDESES